MKKFLAVSGIFILFASIFSNDILAKKKGHFKIVHAIYPAKQYWDWGTDPLNWYPDPDDGEFTYGYENYKDYEVKRSKADAALSEVGLLEKRKAESENAKKELVKIKVVAAKFYKQYTTSSAAVSTADVTLKNSSEFTVVAVIFRGKLITAKTGKTLIEGDFKCDLPEALNPGEENVYEIALNDFAGWAKVKVSDTTKFEVTIIGIGLNNGIVYVNAFSDKDQKKLDTLKEKYVN
jgi:hypothetical protein